MMNGSSVYPGQPYYNADFFPPLQSCSNSMVQWNNVTYGGVPTAIDICQQVPPEFYGYNADSGYYNAASGHSTGTPSPHSLENGPTWNVHQPDGYYGQTSGYGCYQSQTRKRGMANSKKERRRTISINGAFSNLRDCIPNVPKDTKLSKIKTLRLASSYIQHLMDTLSGETVQPLSEFKVDLTRKTPCRAEKRKSIEAEIAAAAERKSKGRHGWPQTIWTQDQKHDESSNISHDQSDRSSLSHDQSHEQSDKSSQSHDQSHDPADNTEPSTSANGRQLESSLYIGKISVENVDNSF